MNIYTIQVSGTFTDQFEVKAHSSEQAKNMLITVLETHSDLDLIKQAEQDIEREFNYDTIKVAKSEQL